jgi:hypothetical protein
VRKIAPVGHTFRQADSVQCLQTSELMSHRNGSSSRAPSPSTRSAVVCSTNATCRQLFAPSSEVLSNDSPLQTSPSSGTRFHSLHATSHALHPMQTLVSVKNPIRGCASSP